MLRCDLTSKKKVFTPRDCNTVSLRAKTKDFFCNCDCNYILFTKLLWPGDNEGTFRSSSQAATCPPVYHTWRMQHRTLRSEFANYVPLTLNRTVPVYRTYVPYLGAVLAYRTVQAYRTLVQFLKNTVPCFFFAYRCRRLPSINLVEQLSVNDIPYATHVDEFFVYI